MRRTNIRGHALQGEGKPWEDNGEGGYLRVYRSTGRALCECGAISTPLSTDSARKRWHADHKAAISTEGES